MLKITAICDIVVTTPGYEAGTDLARSVGRSENCAHRPRGLSDNTLAVLRRIPVQISVDLHKLLKFKAESGS
jgi:hypothetical protein